MRDDQRFSPESAFSYLEQLAFERFAGTEGESRAAHLIAEMANVLGLYPTIEKFDLKTYSIKESEVQVTEPYHKVLPHEPVGLSGSTAPDGIESGICYVEDAGRYYLNEALGKIALYPAALNLDKYVALINSNAVAVILVEGTPRKLPTSRDIPVEWLSKGRLPMVVISYEEALEMIKRGAKTSRIKLVQNEMEAKSANVIVDIRGSRYPDEIVGLAAHYDSTKGTIGATDNAAGTAILLELMRTVSRTVPKRTLRFIFCGAEELGLRGSRDYVGRHAKELEKIKLLVNVDIHGQALGWTNCTVTGSDQTKDYVESMTKELGLSLEISQDNVSSDSASFAMKGVPAVSFLRSGGASFFTHTREDDTAGVLPHGFVSIGLILENLCHRLTMAEEFPLAREIPDNVTKKVKDYFEKKLGEKSV